MKPKIWKFEVSLRKGRNALLAGWLLAVAVPLAQAADQTADAAKLQVNLKAKFVEYDQTNGEVGTILAGLTKATPMASLPEVNDTEMSILSGGQFRNVLNALERLDGTDVFTPPEVTTENDGQPKMQAAEVRNIDERTALNWTNTGDWVIGGGSMNGSPPKWVASRLLGPEIKVNPMLGADKAAIQLVISTKNFISNDIPGQGVPEAIYSTSIISPDRVQPRQHYLKFLTSATIWDGQTMAITGLQTTIDGSSTTTNDARKSVIVFVTAMIVNPDGTKYHTDEERARLQKNPPPPVTEK